MNWVVRYQNAYTCNRRLSENASSFNTLGFWLPTYRIVALNFYIRPLTIGEMLVI